MSDLRRIWRIATEGSSWRADDLSGMGGARDPGRWNSLGWDSTPAQASTRGWGDHWLMSQSTLIAEVPSVIVPEEGNLLINPVHSHCSQLKATVLRRWSYDSRLI